jgi:myo-inositol-1(or 4)-monophosphatase
MRTDLNIILDKMIGTAKLAGAFIRKERADFSFEKVQIKGLNDLVSYVDKTSEEQIVSDLALIVPEAGFIVEENSRTGTREYNWIVDPLDGTTNFVHGIPCYSVSIALEYNKQILAGVVYEVSRDECFSAFKGGGAFLNEKKIRVSTQRTLKESLIATGFPVQNFERVEPFFSCLRFFIENSHGIRRIGSAATDLCYLSCGRFDGFFEYNLKPWDVAAGALIVEEAGGTVSDFKGQNNWLYGKEIVCSNSLIRNEFEKVIKENFARGSQMI